MKQRLAALAALLLTITLAGVAPTFAQDKMGDKMSGSKMSDKMGDKMGGKMAGPVFVSKGSKMGYTMTEAKQMGMKDKMGMKLVKMNALPKGYKMSPSKMTDKMGGKMSDKMGGKMDDKMGGGKMDDKMAPKP